MVLPWTGISCHVASHWDGPEPALDLDLSLDWAETGGCIIEIRQSRGKGRAPAHHGCCFGRDRLGHSAQASLDLTSPGILGQ